MNAHTAIQDIASVSPVETEQALLGACLTSPEALASCAGLLDSEHFAEDWHKIIWETMLALQASGTVANELTISSKLNNPVVSGGLKLAAYLGRCSSSTYCPPAYAASFAKQIREAWASREVLFAIETAKADTAAPSADPRGVISDLMQRLDETRLRMDPRRSGFKSAAQVTCDVVDRMAASFAGTLASNAICTGLKDLDHKLNGGFRPGDLVIMAGRPGMGKSLTAVSLSRQSAKAGHAGGFYSLEMMREQIGARFLSDQAYRFDRTLTSGQILHGNLSEYDAEFICEHAKAFADLPLHIDDSSSMSVGEITARTRSLADRYAREGKKLKHVWIDYLKFVRASERYRGQRHYEVGEISASLKAMAKDLDIAVILLAQLNRNVESREDKRPQLSDLRESGDLEADADIVIFLYREAYYLGNSEPKPGSQEHLEWQIKMETTCNKLELIVAKQRMGATGSVEAFCHAGASALRDRVFDEFLPVRVGE